MIHTPGPWRWEFNPSTKRIQLCGGVPRFDCIVMDFVRYGFSGAAPRFNSEIRPHLNVMKRADEFGVVCPGREHHEDWFRLIAHPDASLIAAAPMLLAALKAIVASNEVHVIDSADIEDARRAIAVAESGGE